MTFIAVIGQNQPNGPRESLINCGAVYVKNDESEPYLFYREGDRTVVRLDGYLVCPMDMFTKRQIRAAVKKYYGKPV